MPDTPFDDAARPSDEDAARLKTHTETKPELKASYDRDLREALRKGREAVQETTAAAQEPRADEAKWQTIDADDDVRQSGTPGWKGMDVDIIQSNDGINGGGGGENLERASCSARAPPVAGVREPPDGATATAPERCGQRDARSANGASPTLGERRRRPHTQQPAAPAATA